MGSDADKQYLVELGGRIKYLRLLRSLSQEELAEQAGVHRTYIGMIERGEKNLTILSLKKIAEAFQLDVTLLLEVANNGE